MAVVVSQLTAQISVQGADQAQRNLSSVGTAATQTSEKLSSIKPFNAGNMVSNTDVAAAKLTLLESQVTAAREKLQTLQNAADAGQAVKGVPEAEANLTLLEAKAQQARAGLAELQSGGAQAAEGLQRVDTATQDAGSQMSEFQSTVTKTASEMASNFVESVRSAASEVSGGFFSGIKNAIGGMLDLGNKIGGTIYGIQNFGQMIQQAGQLLLGGNANMEQTQVAFTSLLGSSKAASAELQSLQKIAADTPFELPDLENAEQQLIAFQIPLKNTHPLLLAIGDALSGLGKNTPAMLQQVVSVFGQMNAAGKIQTQDLMQLSSVGINGFSILAKQMGLTTAQVQQMVTDGTIPASKGIEMLRAGMEQTFGGGMQAQSRTFLGLLSTFKDNISAAWRAFTGPEFDAAKVGLLDLGNLVSSSAFQQFATGAGKDVAKIFGDIGATVSYVGNVLRTVNISDFANAWHTVSTEIDYVSSKFGAFVKNLTASKGDFDPIAEAIQKIAGAGLQTITDLLWGLSGAFVDIDEAIENGTGPLAGIVPIFQQIGQAIFNLDPGVNTIEALSSQSQQLGKWFQTSVVPAFRQAEPGFKNLGQAAAGLVPVFVQVSGILKESLQKEIVAMLPVFEKAIPIIIQIAGIIANVLGSAIKFLSPYIVQATAAIGQFADEIVTRIAPVLTKWINEFQKDLNAFLKVWNVIWPYLAPILKGVWDEIVGILRIAWALVSGIILIGLDLLSGNWKQAWADFQTMLQGVWDGIKAYLAGAWEVIKGIFGPVGAFFQGVWKSIQNAFGNVGSWFQTQFTNAKNGTTTGFGNVGSWFTDRWHDIQGAFGNIGSWFQGQFRTGAIGAQDAFSPLGQFFQGVWTNITTIFGNIGAWFAARWQAIITPLQPIITFAQQVFQELWLIIVAVVNRIVANLSAQWNTVVTVAKVAWTMLQTAIEMTLLIIQQKIMSILLPIVNWIAARWIDVKNGVQTAWSWVSITIANIWTTISTAIATKIAQILGTLTNWYNNVRSGVQIAWSWVSATIGNTWNNIFNTVSGKVNQVAGYLNQQWTNIRNTAGSVWSNIAGAIGSWWNNIFNTVSGKVNTLKNNVMGAFGSIRDGIGSVIRGFINNIITQLNNGITGVQNFLNNIGSGLNGIASKLGVAPIIQQVRLGLVPKYATGTPAGGHPGGPMIVGEKGPELMVAPKGTSVLPADDTKKLLAGLMGGVPGYAGGVGDALGNFFSWVGGGARSILNNTLSALGISGFNLPGILNDFTSSIFGKIKDAAVGWIGNILPKFNATNGSGQPVNVPGNVQSWIAAAMALTGVPSNWAGPLATIAMNESGGNPNAQNNTDINAQNGNPSRGLFQTIGSTFAAYMVAGHGNILNPIDNAASAIDYIKARYGSVFNVPGIVSLAHGGGYIGYATGTNFNPSTGDYVVGERGAEIVHLPRGASVIPNHQINSYSNSTEVLARLDRIATLLEQGMTLDGQRLTRAQMPYIVNAIRTNTAVKF